ncbi:MAG: hypothetical protein ACEY3A_01435 [Wolbachia sp.]
MDDIIGALGTGMTKGGAGMTGGEVLESRSFIKQVSIKVAVLR